MDNKDDPHFMLFNMSKDVGSEVVKKSLVDGLRNRAREITAECSEEFRSRCVADVYRNLAVMRNRRASNEAGVRFCFANSIVVTLCEAFNLCVELEEETPDFGELVNTSTKSKTDYVCWKLYHKQVTGENMFTAAIVMEIKHLPTLNHNCIAQVMGYYSKAKVNENKTGCALLFNENDSVITFQIIFFPYTDGSRTAYGIQGLVTPKNTCSRYEFLTEAIVIIFLACKPDNPIFTFESDTPVIPLLFPKSIVEVLTKEEFQAGVIEELTEVVKKQAEENKEQAATIKSLTEMLQKE